MLDKHLVASFEGIDPRMPNARPRSAFGLDTARVVPPSPTVTTAIYGPLQGLLLRPSGM